MWLSHPCSRRSCASVSFSNAALSPGCMIHDQSQWWSFLATAGRCARVPRQHIETQQNIWNNLVFKCHLQVFHSDPCPSGLSFNQCWVVERVGLLSWKLVCETKPCSVNDSWIDYQHWSPPINVNHPLQVRKLVIYSWWMIHPIWKKNDNFVKCDHFPKLLVTHISKIFDSPPCS